MRVQCRIVDAEDLKQRQKSPIRLVWRNTPSVLPNASSAANNTEHDWKSDERESQLL
jgi:hypothetical protein